jgi:DNA-binding transcriptional ArsR family regulator
VSVQELRDRGGHHDVWAALGDATRREILELLRRRPCAVGEVADALPVSRPAVSQHLKVLHDAGLVAFTSRGTRNVYHLDPGGLEPLRGWLDGFWQDALDRFADYVRAQEPVG